MNQHTAKKIFEIQQACTQDKVYQGLLQEYASANDRLLECLDTLPPAQQDAVFDHLGLVAQMHLRMLEIACE